MITNWVKDYYETKGTEKFEETINNIVSDVNSISPIFDKNELNVLRFNLQYVDKFVETTFFTYGINYFVSKFSFKIPRLKTNIFQNVFSKLDIAK